VISTAATVADRTARKFLFCLALTVLLAAGARAHAQSNEDCMACHSDTTLTMERGRRSVPLFVDEGVLARSPHKDFVCVDCHAGFNPEEFPHNAKISPVNCMSCHSDAAGTHPFHSIMSTATGTDGARGTSCKQCHGTHDVLPLSSPDAPFSARNLTSSCGKCHPDIAGQFSRSEHGRALAQGEPGAPSCIGCHTNPITVTRAQGERSAKLKIEEERICLGCHLDNPEVRARMGPGAGFIASYETSVHGAALTAGNAGAATCIDCHGSHEMKRGIDPEARVSKSHIPDTCAKCHGQIASEYDDSIHGLALARGNIEAPVCTDCHGEHNILLHSDPNSPVAAGNVSTMVCSPCHSSVRLTSKYGIASDRFQTFSDSYHGLALRGGSLEAANCTSCHGVHDIKPSSDPASRTNKANLATTCGECHPGANERFAVGDVHVAITEEKEPILYWIATTYIILIVTTIGVMLIHNLADFLRKSQRRMKLRRGEIEEPYHGHALYLRMTLGERIQHGSLMASFIVLVITGFMLSYPESWWVEGIRRLSDHAFELRSLTHRTAAVVMVAASLVHIGYVTLSRRGRRLIVDLLPRFDDLHEAFGVARYNLGLSRTKPDLGRFSYIEKAEYWALVWGTIVMAVTGVIMWFENTSIGVITKLGWDIARTIHFYEAWLATLAILVWHIYFVIFNPDVYPMNMAWLTGRLTESEMAEEHPRELAAIRSKENDTESTG